MKLFAGLLIVVSLIFSFAKGQPISIEKKETTDSLTLKAKKLKQYYLVATKSSSLKEVYEQKFFDEFPDNFTQLNELYGYDFNAHKASVLYKEGEKHIIELFNNLNSIKDTVYYKKIIKIAIGGHWDADAISYFQDGLRSRVESNPELTVYLLASMGEKETKSFWYFYFDDAHPKEKIAESLLKIKSLNIKIYNLMVQAHEKVLKEDKE